jgi:pyruvate, water dikinase
MVDMKQDHELILGIRDCAGKVDVVGSKAANLGLLMHILSQDDQVGVPEGFVVTARACEAIMLDNPHLRELNARLNLDLGHSQILEVCRVLRSMISGDMRISSEIQDALYQSYCRLTMREESVHVAVRSSASIEDTEAMSMAGLFDSFLHISTFDDMLEATKKCMSSQYNERLVEYLLRKNVLPGASPFAVIVQEMVPSDLGASGVIFTYDPELRSSKLVVVEAARGLGEAIVQGQVIPDHYKVFKPLVSGHFPIIAKRLGNQEVALRYDGSGIGQVPLAKETQDTFVLCDEEVMTLARTALFVEQELSHYSRISDTLDIEWARNGISCELSFLQVRPFLTPEKETRDHFTYYDMTETKPPILQGIGIGMAIETGNVSVIRSMNEFSRFRDGDILVAPMTNPQWMPLMLRASGFITDRGTASSHAAIVARELNVPCVLGTVSATEVLQSGCLISLFCSGDGKGAVYEGEIEHSKSEFPVDIPSTRTEILLHVGIPETAFRHARLPNSGVGAARTEFVSSSVIGIHPKVFLDYETLKDRSDHSGEQPCLRELIRAVDDCSRGYTDKRKFYVERLAQGIAEIASAFYPKPIFAKLSDFKTNEYRDMLGGYLYEPVEENPMLGWRGASRYYDPDFIDVFRMECEAFRRVREEMGLRNVNVMVPFCRTLKEAHRVFELLERFGLSTDVDRIGVFCLMETPAQVIMADEYAEYFDGFLIGLNDLFQTILGVDRDSEKVAHLLDSRDPAIRKAISRLIREARAKGKETRAIGQIISTDDDFVRFLVGEGIQGIVVNPDPRVIAGIAQVILNAEREFD